MENKDFVNELVDFCKERHIDSLETSSVVDGYTVKVYVDKEDE